jgi:hypothetical protein
MKNPWLLALAACTGLLAVPPLARAQEIGPGEQKMLGPPIGTVGFDVFDRVPPFGQPPAPFSFDGVSGTYQELVVSHRDGNPYGGFSFEYQFTVTTGIVLTVTATGFDGTTAVGQTPWLTTVTSIPTDPDQVGANLAMRDGGPNKADNITFFAFGPGGFIGAGQTSQWLIVDTPSNTEGAATITFAVSASSGSVPGLGPGFVGVPEPGTLPLALVSLFLAGACFVYRRLTRPRGAWPAC